MGNKKEYDRKRYKKERRFRGNQFGSSSESQNGNGQDQHDRRSQAQVQDHCFQSQATHVDVALNSSASKIEISTETKEVTDRIMSSSPTADFYVFINTDILLSIIEMIGICPECHSKVKCHHDDSATKKKGLAHVFVATCCSCPWYHDLYTSKEIVSAKRGNNKYNVNVRAFIAFREIGRGHSSIQTFCQYMNMASPMTKKNYDNLALDIHFAYVGASRESMLKA